MHLQTQSAQVAGGASVPNPLTQGAIGMIVKQIIDKIQEDSAKTRSTMAKGGRKTRSAMTKGGDFKTGWIDSYVCFCYEISSS